MTNTAKLKNKFSGSGETALRAIIGAVPYAGTGMIEVLFEHRSRLKEKRLQEFFNLLSEYIRENNEFVEHLDRMNKDDLSDVLESVIVSVSKARSRKKQAYFKDILVGAVTIEGVDVDLVQVYIDLTDSLKEGQIRILKNLYSAKIKESELDSRKDEVKQELREVKSKIMDSKSKAEKGITSKHTELWANLEAKEAKLQAQKNDLDKEIEKMDVLKEAYYYRMEQGEFDYYMRDLVSNGMLSEFFYTEHGGTSTNDSVKSLTPFACDYIEFLKTEL